MDWISRCYAHLYLMLSGFFWPIQKVTPVRIFRKYCKALLAAITSFKTAPKCLPNVSPFEQHWVLLRLSKTTCNITVAVWVLMIYYYMIAMS